MMKPRYDQGGFAHIPQRIRDAFDHDSEVVVLILIDGFGWHLFERYADEFPLLRRLAHHGEAHKITSQFPSTTAAHLTTLYTGLPVSESGVFEWWYYEPELDRVFAPLLFSTQGARAVEPVDRAVAGAVFPDQTLFHTLARAGVSCYSFISQHYADSPFSSHMSRGARVVPFTTIPEALINLDDAVERETERAYYCAYFDVIDAIGHRYGPDSAHMDAELRALFSAMERHLRAVFTRPRTRILVTADHGVTATDECRIMYLDVLVPDLARWTETTRDGLPLTPAGARRDMFLYVKQDHCDEAIDALDSALAGRATVARTQALVDQGYFGPSVSQRLLDRLGNVVVLPDAHEMVWWSGDGRHDVARKRGDHGGLSPDELEIPLLIHSA